jgi:small subunit ribosomal protein S17
VSESTSAERGRRKSLVGVVVSNKMDKTAVVAVERRQPHSLYRKIVRQTTRYKAHDPNNQAVLGDVVRIEETRPISKDKRWRIAETLTRGNVAEIAPRDIGTTDVEMATPAPQAPETASSDPAEEKSEEAEA